MDLLERLIRHDAWMTRQFLEHCRSLTDEQFHHAFDIGPGTLHDTLLHNVDVMFGWADRIADRERRPNLPERRYAIDELLTQLDDAAAALETTARAVHDEDRLDEMMAVTHDGRTWQFTRGTAIAHVITHGMHHRAQALNMFRRAGAPCALDGDVIEWEVATRPARSDS